jgi:hypothetical protein
VVSVSGDAGAGLTPFFNVGGEVGAYNNITSDTQGWFAEGHGQGLTLEPEKWLNESLFSIFVSPIGANLTLYNGKH